jgi:Icc-related predicted phosphoesterase
LEQKALNCFFVSDLHGRVDRYESLFECLARECPAALFIGGDILPSPFAALRGGYELPYKDFIRDYLVKKFQELKQRLKGSYPRVFAILGNDDAKMEEPKMWEAEEQGLWEYCHNRCIQWDEFTVYGYTYIPPSPFRLKDWERLDVTDYVRPGCLAPGDERSAFTVRVDEHEIRTATIETDLQELVGEDHLEKSIFLFHSPPHRCKLDRAALDGHRIDDLQVDVHVGSTAIRRFIQKRQPLITLHGHIHESTRLTGAWRENFNGTTAFNASHDGRELALVRFDPYQPAKASRELL